MAERQIVTVLFAGAVGDNQRRARVGLRFLNRFHRLIQLRPQRNLRDVNMSVHHHADAEVLTRLALAMLTKFGDRAERSRLRCLAAGIGITLGIENQNVDVFGQAQDVVETAEANVIGPAIAADKPDGFLNQRIGIG